MKIDFLPKPKTLWIEDLEGNILQDYSDGKAFIIDPYPPKMTKKYMHSKVLQVTESVCGDKKHAKWPVKLLRFIANLMPYSWQGHNSEIFRGNSSVNGGFDIIKYLVEKCKWSFSDAAVAYSDMCSRCTCICELEIKGEDIAKHQQYLRTINARCDLCWYLDPAYMEKKRIKACYAAFKYDKDIQKAYDECWCPSGILCYKEDDKRNIFYRVKAYLSTKWYNA